MSSSLHLTQYYCWILFLSVQTSKIVVCKLWLPDLLPQNGQGALINCRFLGSTSNSLTLTIWGWPLGTHILHSYEMIPNTHKIWWKKCFLNICCQAWPPAPAFVQVGFWIQDKPLYFLVFRFHLIRCGALPQPIEIRWVLYPQRMTSWQPRLIKMKSLRVAAPEVTLSTSGGISFHTDTNDDRHLITNTLIPGSSFPWDKWATCHFPNASGKPKYFFAFSIFHEIVSIFPWSTGLYQLSPRWQRCILTSHLHKYSGNCGQAKDCSMQNTSSLPMTFSGTPMALMF